MGESAYQIGVEDNGLQAIEEGDAGFLKTPVTDGREVCFLQSSFP